MTELLASPFEVDSYFSLKEIKAEASETMRILMRSNAGCRRELCKDVSFNEHIKDGPLFKKNEDQRQQMEK
jgi:hypothetical protein